MNENIKTPKIRFKGFTEDWEQRKLLGSADYIDGNYGESYPKDSEFVESGIPFFTSAVTGSQGIWNYKYVKYITKEKNDTLIKAQSKGGDLVLTNRGASMGVVSQIPLHYKEVNIGPQLTRIRGKEKILDNLFLLSNLKTKKCYDQLLASNAGSAMPFISLTNLSELDINVPNFNEQIKIGTIFKNIDNLITLHQRKYDKLVNIKKSMLEKMFPKNDSKIPEIRFKEFTEDWEQRKLNNMCSIITKQTGFDYSATIKPSLVEHKIPNSYSFIQNKDFDGLNINLNTDFYIPKNIADQFPKITLDTPSLLISISGKIGNVGFYSFKNKAFIGGAVGICKLINPDDGILSTYELQSEYGQKYFQSLIKASSHANITVEDIRNIELILPKNSKERSNISKFLLNIDNLITLHQRKLDKLNNFKKSMLEKMFV